MTEPQEPEGYTTESDKMRARKEKKQRRKQTLRQEAREFEPRRFSPEQRSFARRFNEGMSMLGGDN